MTDRIWYTPDCITPNPADPRYKVCSWLLLRSDGTYRRQALAGRLGDIGVRIVSACDHGTWTADAGCTLTLRTCTGESDRLAVELRGGRLVVGRTTYARYDQDEASTFTCSAEACTAD